MKCRKLGKEDKEKLVRLLSCPSIIFFGNIAGGG